MNTWKDRRKRRNKPHNNAVGGIHAMRRVYATWKRRKAERST